MQENCSRFESGIESIFDIRQIKRLAVIWAVIIIRETSSCKRISPSTAGERGITESLNPLPPGTRQIQYSSDKRFEIERNGEYKEIWYRTERKLKELDTLCVPGATRKDRWLWATWSCPRHLPPFSSRT